MILVTGATGNVGSELVPQLLELNQPVRVLTRDPRKVAGLGSHVETAVGSFDQPATLDVALQNVDRVFLMTNEVGHSHAEAMANAASRAGVRQIVYLSSTGASIPSILLGKWHHDREEAIRASGVDWTFLRPGNFMSNALMWAESVKTKETVFFPGGEGKTAPIDPRDIASVAAAALTQPGHNGRVYELTGGELLTVADQVDVLSGVLGRPIRYVEVPPSALSEQMIKRGMPQIVADAVSEVFTLVRDRRTESVTDTFEQVTGRKPRSFEAWCSDHSAAFQ